MDLVTLNQDEFTIKIKDVDMTDEGQYVCAVQTSSRPRTTSVHLLVQGKAQTLPPRPQQTPDPSSLALFVAVRNVKE